MRVTMTATKTVIVASRVERNSTTITWEEREEEEEETIAYLGGGLTAGTFLLQEKRETNITTMCSRHWCHQLSTNSSENYFTF